MTHGQKPIADADQSKNLSVAAPSELGAMALFEIQRKNLQALQEASRLAAEGVQAVARRQAEFFAGAVDEAWRTLQAAMTPQATPERMAKQAELVKHAFDTAVPAARELSNILAQAQGEAMAVLNRRLGESIDEMRALMPTRGK